MLEAHGNLYLGHMSGEITVWGLEQGICIDEYPFECPAPVDAMRFCNRYHILVYSYSNSTEGRVKAVGTRRKYSKTFDGTVGKVLGLLIFDEKNIVLGVDSFSKQILMWDIITGNLLLSSLLPEFFQACSATCMCATGLSKQGLGFAIGFTNNSVAWGSLGYNQEACHYFFDWRGRAKSTTEGNVLNIAYSESIEGLVMSCNRSMVLILEGLSRETKVVEQKKPLFSLTDREETHEITTNIRVYRRTPTNKFPSINQDMVNKIRERIDGKKISENSEKSEGGKRVENLSGKNEVVKIVEGTEGVGGVRGKYEEVLKDTEEDVEVIDLNEEEREDRGVIGIDNEYKSDLIGDKSENMLEDTGKISDEGADLDVGVPVEFKEVDKDISENMPTYSEIYTEKVIVDEEIEAPVSIAKIPEEITHQENNEKILENEVINQSIKSDFIIVAEIINPQEEKEMPSGSTSVHEDKSLENNREEEESKEFRSTANHENHTRSESITDEIEEKKNHKPEIEGNKAEVMNKVENTPKPKPLSPFQLFLQAKKPELLKDNPSITHKEVVMKVTKLWGELTEEQRQMYEASSYQTKS